MEKRETGTLFKVTGPMAVQKDDCSKRDNHPKRESKSTGRTVVKVTTKHRRFQEF